MPAILRGVSMKTIKTLLMIFICCLFQNAFAEIDTSSQKRIFAEINAYRVKQGLSPLKMNSVMNEVAQKHSQDMANHVVPFSHQGFGKRMNKLFSEFKHSRGIAENVAYAYHDTKGIVRLWLNSSGHRRNIEGKFNLTGIGVAYDGKRVYVTQIFLLNKGLTQ